jgi:FG-GAP-like repeat
VSHRRDRRIRYMVLVLAAATATTPVTFSATAATVDWSAVNVVTASGLNATTETWEATPVDFDNDGDQDVWVGHHDQGGTLWRNAGARTYTRAAASAWPKVNADGLIPDRHYCAWADVDHNGLPDAYCTAGRGGRNAVKNGKDNELWLQRTPGAFAEVGTEWNVGDVCGRSHYAAFLRANGDAYSDLFVGNAPPRDDPKDPCNVASNRLTSEQSKLYINVNGRGLAANTQMGISGYGGSRCAEVADINADGWDDLLVCGPPGTKLYRNNRGAGFTDVAASNGLASTVTDADFGDLDGDGDVDLVTAEWGRIAYRLNTDGQFGSASIVYRVPSGSGGRGVAVADADGDGDLDVYALLSNVPRGTNPDDVVLLNAQLRFTPVDIPAAGGVGDSVVALDGDSDGTSDFLVLNGVEVAGPTQLIRLRAAG